MTLMPDIPSPKGLIFDIQGLSVHDGPGCRTLVFMKGCSLRCSWCSNPEGISIRPDLMYDPAKCITCGNCVNNCVPGALKIEPDKLHISRQRCVACDRRDCADACDTGALRFCGYEITVGELFNIIRRDRQFWGDRGGITLTGGEPLLQIDFAGAILERCYHAYINTAIETCGNVPWEHFGAVIPYTDWIFFDLKHPDHSEHQKATGCGNRLIFENAMKLSQQFKGRLIFRTPLIPEYNDSKNNLLALARFIKETGRHEINLLPLHHLGREKYHLLGIDYPAAAYPVPSMERLYEIREIFNSSGIDCYIGSDTPF